MSVTLRKLYSALALAGAVVVVGTAPAVAQTSLLNVSYDVARDSTRTTTRFSRSTGRKRAAEASN